jgi:hypothetical protein
MLYWWPRHWLCWIFRCNYQRDSYWTEFTNPSQSVIAALKYEYLPVGKILNVHTTIYLLLVELSWPLLGWTLSITAQKDMLQFKWAMHLLHFMDGPGIESQWGQDFQHPSRPALGAHPASCTMGTGSCPRVKRPEHGVDHPPSSSAEVKERVWPYLYSLLGSGFGGLVVSLLASGTQDHGFEPGRSRRIFQGEKIYSMPSFGREVKPSVPCRRFAACKRTLRFTWKSELQAKLTGHFLP